MIDLDADVPVEQWSVDRVDFARIVALSDGVFAFALTLLAVTMTLPALDSAHVATDLPLVLWGLRFPFSIYVLTFLIVYLKWNLHRRLFRILRRYDNRLLTINMFFLLFIAAMPLPANVVLTYGDQSSAVVFFAGYQVLVTLVEVLMWHYATLRHRLIEPALPHDWLTMNALRLWLVILLFALSMALAQWSPGGAEYAWLLLFGVTPFTHWLHRTFSGLSGRNKT